MLTIITCSINTDCLNNLKKNIEQTIGVDYELLAIDNTINPVGICKVYNNAAAKAKYPYLCFVHEDVRFWTENWGQYMIQTLEDESVGILGFCGGKYYPNVPGSWLDIPSELRRFSMLSASNGEKKYLTIKDGPEETHISTTVTLDGLLLAIPKKIWRKFPFNEEMIKGFHFYDIDICLRVQTKYKLVIDHRIFVEHFSSGQDISKQWISQALHFYNHRPVKGPISLIRSPATAVLEDFAYKRFVERIAAVNDFKWRVQTLMRLLFKFPWLYIRNFPFYIQVVKRMNTSKHIDSSPK